MHKLNAAPLGVLLALFAGCDTGRVNELEKQNQALKAQLAKQNAVQNFDLQAKCSKDARAWVNVNWAETSRDKDTIFFNFSNHYNAKLNKCFAVIEWHYNSHLYGADGGSWTNDTNLYDVYENVQYGNFSENHVTHYRPQIAVHHEVVSCDVQGVDCKTNHDYYNLLRPYLNE